MGDDISTELLIPDECVGGTIATITVVVRNIGSADIKQLNVEALRLPGLLLGQTETSETAVAPEYVLRRRRLMAELERQASAAYHRRRMSHRTRFQVTGSFLLSLLEAYIRLFSFTSRSSDIPYWAAEALKVNSWNDVLRLEKELIEELPAEVFLKKRRSMGSGRDSSII